MQQEESGSVGFQGGEEVWHQGEEHSVVVVPEGELEQSGGAIQEEGLEPIGEMEVGEQSAVQTQREVQVHRTEAVGTETIQGEEESSGSDLDRFIQGEVAPPLTKKEQMELAKKGIFLVVATNVVGDIFVTQLAEKYYSKEEQRDICKCGGRILISRTEDTHEVYQMSNEIDHSIFPVKGKKRVVTATAMATAAAGTSNVAVAQDEEMEEEV